MNKKIIRTFLFTAIIALVFPFKVSAESDLEANMMPTPPPSVPAADFSNEYGQLFIGAYGGYFEMETDIKDEDGENYIWYTGYGGINTSYTLGITESFGISFGLGYGYQEGGLETEFFSSDFDINVDGHIFPMNISLAKRVYGTPETTNLMLFGGIEITRVFLSGTYEATLPGSATYYNYTTTDMNISGGSAGILTGLKLDYKLASWFSIIPYLALRATTTSISMTMDTETHYEGDITHDSDSDSSSSSSTSMMLGFDIQLGGLSVGTLLNLYSSDEYTKNYFFHAGYTFKM